MHHETRGKPHARINPKHLQNRCKEIQSWLDGNPDRVSTWVAIDDLPLGEDGGAAFDRHFVLTDPREGLTRCSPSRYYRVRGVESGVWSQGCGVRGSEGLTMCAFWWQFGGWVAASSDRALQFRDVPHASDCPLHGTIGFPCMGRNITMFPMRPIAVWDDRFPMHGTETSRCFQCIQSSEATKLIDSGRFVAIAQSRLLQARPSHLHHLFTEIYFHKLVSLPRKPWSTSTRLVISLEVQDYYDRTEYTIKWKYLEVFRNSPAAGSI